MNPTEALATILELTTRPDEPETVINSLVTAATWADGTVCSVSPFHSSTYIRRQNADAALRNLLIDYRNSDIDEVQQRIDEAPTYYDDEADPVDIQALQDALTVLWDDQYSRDTLSRLAIEQSLCPLHFVDWAICFDDEDPACAQIRQVFPHGHDT